MMHSFVKTFVCCLNSFKGFPGGSVGKESTCDIGDPGLIPWLGIFFHVEILPVTEYFLPYWKKCDF